MLRTRNTLPYRGAANDTYCIAMFLRACQQNDLRAQAWIERHFRPTVLNWIRHHPCREIAYSCHTETYYVAETFERLWQTAQKFPLASMKLPVLQRYIQTCVNAVIVDALRTAAATTPAQLMSDASWLQGNGNEIWHRLQRMLSNAREQRLVYLLYSCGLTPSEIVHRFPQEFADVAEIHRLRCRIIAWLQQSV